jgi:hypothetical protein
MREAMAGEREKRLQLLNSRKGGNFWAAAGANYVPKVKDVQKCDLVCSLCSTLYLRFPSL